MLGQAVLVDISEAGKMNEAKDMDLLLMDKALDKLEGVPVPSETAAKTVQRRSPALTSGLRVPSTCACILG